MTRISPKKKQADNSFKVPESLKPFVESFYAETEKDAKDIFESAIAKVDTNKSEAIDLVVAFHIMRHIKPKNDFEKSLYTKHIVSCLQKNIPHLS